MKKFVVVIGHEPDAPGAVNQTYNMTEYDFNKELASLIANELREHDVNPIIIYRDTLSALPRDINAIDAVGCISLHCNAFNKIASGTEMLIFKGSSEGRKLATYLQEEVVKCLQLRDRGIKEVTSEDNGGYLLKGTRMPTVLMESFFIDNNTDYVIADAEKENLAKAIVKGLLKYLR